MTTRDSIIVLTGCTRGLGLAMTRYFIAEGATVAACGRSPESIGGLREEFGKQHDFSVVDVANAAAVDSWADQVIARFGYPTLLINNAVVIARNAPLWKVPPAEIDAVLSVNLRGTVNVLRAYLPGMIALNPGVINTDMLRECFGESAESYPTAEQWVAHAGPFLLKIGAKDHGQSLTVPGVPLG